LTAGAISLVFASLLYFAGVGIAPELRLFYLAALPLVSALLLVMGAADPFPSAMSGAGEDLDRRSPERRVYRKLVAASALVALTAGIGKGVSSALVPTETFAREGGIIVLCVGVIGVLIAYVVNRGDAVRGARQVYSGLMVLGVAMMLSTCFGFDIAYLSVGKESLWLVFSCFMAYLAFRYDFSPVRMFAIGQGVYFLASTAGWAVGSALAPYYGDSMVRMGTGIALAFMVIVVLVYVFPEIDLKRVMAWSVDSERGERAPVKRATVPAFASASAGDAEVAASIGVARATDQRYGLSSRELEILDLFAQGRSANWIADNLTISKNTVRSHLRAIYTKLDVHTRQELLDFLGE
ncbi:MAG: helix-turn-helix transcriptional regulator, partial [Eggerthella lenta]|nr:helix-turn-helix transcriptional regulator [Eggerthella lenta]